MSLVHFARNKIFFNFSLHALLTYKPFKKGRSFRTYRHTNLDQQMSFKWGFLDFFLSMYVIQHCFICRPSDSTVSENAGFEPRTVETLVLTARRSNLSARSHPHQLDLIHKFSKCHDKYFCCLTMSQEVFSSVQNLNKPVENFYKSIMYRIKSAA